MAAWRRSQARARTEERHLHAGNENLGALRFLKELNREEGTTILLTTHYMEEADLLSDRIGIIDTGKVIALDTPEKLKAQIDQQEIIKSAANETFVIWHAKWQRQNADALKEMQESHSLEESSGQPNAAQMLQHARRQVRWQPHQRVVGTDVEAAKLDLTSTNAWPRSTSSAMRSAPMRAAATCVRRTRPLLR